MPDLIDRTRLASIAVLAAFALLGLVLVSHIAHTGTPLSLPGLSGKGQVLTTPEKTNGSNGSSGSQSGATGAGAASGGAAGTSAGTPTADEKTNLGAPDQSGAPKDGSPRQVGISIGAATPSQPGSTPQGPSSTPTSGSGTSGSGSNPAGTGSGQENGSDTQPAGPSNNYGHSPSTPSPPSTGAATNGHSPGSQTSGTLGSTQGSSQTSASGSTTAAGGSTLTVVATKVKNHQPGHLK